jgi:NUBPL iron-transfer P-loop NTPase
MIVDMPPETGDAQLTMAQQVPLAAAVIVSTRQDIAFLHVRKGLNMSKNVPVLGIDQTMHSLFGACNVTADVLVQEYGRYFGMKTVCFCGGCLSLLCRCFSQRSLFAAGRDAPALRNCRHRSRAQYRGGLAFGRDPRYGSSGGQDIRSVSGVRLGIISGAERPSSTGLRRRS